MRALEWSRCLLHKALPGSRKRYTPRLVLSFLDQCRFVCPHLSALEEEVEELLEAEELLEEGWYSPAA